LNRMIGLADYFGMTASTICLLHCIGTPLLLSFFPLFGLGGRDEAFHRIMVVLVSLPVLFALAPGFLAHRRWTVLALGGFGLSLFIAAVLLVGPRYGESAETVLAVIGGLHLFAAHSKNRTFCRTCTAQTERGICLDSICNPVAKGREHGH
jgi:hypothetical protein